MTTETLTAPIMAQTKEKPLLSNTLKLFMVAMVLANIAGEMYGTLLPLYLKELNANVVQIGLFFTIARIIPLAFQILGGWISDSLGRLRSVAIGSTAGLLGYIAALLAPTWQWMLLSEALGATTRSLIGPSFSAFIAEESTEENRARVYGITESIFMLVTVIGPPLAGFLVGAFSFRFMLFIAALIYAAATAIRIWMARRVAKSAASAEGEHPQSAPRLSFASLRDNLKSVALLVLGGGILTWIVITDGVRDIAFSMSFTLESLYLEEIAGLSIQQIGFLPAIFGLCMMAVTIPAGWLADKKGERVAIALGFLLNGIAIWLFLQATHFWLYAASWALFGIGGGIMSPAYQSLTSKAVPENMRGTAFGLIHSGLGLFSLPAPAIGAQLWERVSPRFPFQITAIISLLTVIPAWFKFKLNKADDGTPKTTD